GVRAEHAAQHAVRVAAMYRHRADQCGPAPHLDLRVGLRHAFALRQPEILGPVVAIAVVLVRVDRVEVPAGRNTQPEALEPRLDDGWPADQDRTREPFVDHDLYGAQHALLFALGVDDGLRRRLRGGGHRLYHQSGVVDATRQGAPGTLVVGCL